MFHSFHSFNNSMNQAMNDFHQSMAYMDQQMNDFFSHPFYQRNHTHNHRHNNNRHSRNHRNNQNMNFSFGSNDFSFNFPSFFNLFEANDEQDMHNQFFDLNANQSSNRRPHRSRHHSNQFFNQGQDQFFSQFFDQGPNQFFSQDPNQFFNQQNQDQNQNQRPNNTSQPKFEKKKLTPAEYIEQTECPICLNRFDFNVEYPMLKCGHYFHKECIDPWLQTNSTCPVCRQDAF